MSTKIYEGRRLVEGVSLFEMNTRLRELLNPVRDRLDAELLVDEAVRLIDDADFFGKPRPDVPVVQAYMDFTEDQRKEDRRSAMFDPNSFSMSIGLDAHTGRVLVLPFFQRAQYGQVLDASGLFEDYGYWDNSDQPEDVTDAQWQARGDAWERVMPGYAPPVETMLTFELRAWHDIGMFRLAKRQPGGRVHSLLMESLAAHPRQARADRLAGGLCLRALREAEPEANPIDHAWQAHRDSAPVAQAILPLLSDITEQELLAAAKAHPTDISTVTQAVEQWMKDRG